MMRIFICTLAAAAALAAQPAEQGPERWESAIQAFEQAAKKVPPPQGAILFLGSSSIRRWDLEKSFPGVETVNRGFGGSVIRDSIHYFDRLVTPLRPRKIVFYAGDNDIGRGMTAPEVVSDFKEFMALVHKKLPETEVVYLPVKPSLARKHLMRTQEGANQLIREMSWWDPKLEYVELVEPMLNKDGEPRPELFVEDGLHLSPEGEKLWTKLVKPYLD